MASGNERQKKLIQKRKDSGMQCFALWIPEKQASQLKKLYTGERGGVLWADVVDAAIQARSKKKCG